MFALIAALLVAPVAPSGQWSVGREREVDEGVYMRLVAQESGWRIWRVETRGGVTCKAVKSARGRAHPTPVGVAAMMEGGSPYVEVIQGFGNRPFSYAWGAHHYAGIRPKWRAVGARFWEEPGLMGTDLGAFAEQAIEVNLVSFEYAEIFVGRVEENAVLDLAGLGWAQEQITACQTATVQ